MAYLLTTLLLFINYLEAKDFGTYGTVFPIIEEDFLKTLTNRINAIQEDNLSLKRLKNDFIQSAKNPKGLKMPQTKEKNIHYYDPTYVVKNDITDHEGKIILRKGIKFNPLDYVKLQENLLFFDGNDLKQVDWALKEKGKFILVDGNPLDLEEKLERPFYFDQGGYLINKLEITSLPARVSQDSKRLKIQETPCD